MINVTIWNENLHEKSQEEVRRIYPDGIHGCIADFLSYNEDIRIHLATFEEPEHGLTQEILDETDVLVYWSHMAQEEFSDEVAERIHQAVLQGMGLVALHSAHYSKIMKKLLGTSMTLKWRHGDRERIFVTAPSHPIARYVPEYIELPVEEAYGEYFDIPKPDDVVFTGWFSGGEVFRSGCTFQRGLGKIFYFQPGHETYPTYHDKYIQRIITNAVYWCAPARRLKQPMECHETKIPPEEISGYAARENKNTKRVNLGSKNLENQNVDGGVPDGDVKLSIFYEHLREASEQTGKSLQELLREAYKAGIRGVEMEFSTLVQRPELGRLIKDEGLKISNLYQFFDFGNRYAAGMHTGRKMIDTAKAMDVSRVMIIPGFLEPEQSRALNRASASFQETAAYMESLREIRAMRDALTELTEYAAERDIMVSMEDFDSFTSPIARMNPIKWFLQQVPGLKHTLDMGNYAFSNESVEEAYELFRDQIGHVHCKDRGQETETDPRIWEELGASFGEELAHRRGMKPVPVGDGYVPVAKLVRRLKEQGYQGYLAIEHFGAPDQRGFMLKSAEYLNGLLKES